jgi:hypothetical protein
VRKTPALPQRAPIFHRAEQHIVKALHGVTAAPRRGMGRIRNRGETEHRGKSRGFPHRRFRYDRFPHGLVLLVASIVVTHVLRCIRSVPRIDLAHEGAKGALPPRRVPETVPPQPAPAQPETTKPDNFSFVVPRRQEEGLSPDLRAANRGPETRTRLLPARHPKDFAG